MPVDYLARARMDQACALLRGGTTVTQVAPQVGYDSPISCTRAFRRVTGETPAAYQRARRALPAA